MSSRTCLIRTASDGTYEWNATVYGALKGITIDLGTLETPNIVITDEAAGVTLLTRTALAASAYVQPGAAMLDNAGVAIEGAYGSPVVHGSLRVAVTGGGDTKTGRVRFLLET